MRRLSKEQVILLHKRLIEVTGGSDGIRDNGMLDCKPIRGGGSVASVISLLSGSQEDP